MFIYLSSLLKDRDLLSVSLWHESVTASHEPSLCCSVVTACHWHPEPGQCSTSHALLVFSSLSYPFLFLPVFVLLCSPFFSNLSITNTVVSHCSLIVNTAVPKGCGGGSGLWAVAVGEDVEPGSKYISAISVWLDMSGRLQPKRFNDNQAADCH